MDEGVPDVAGYRFRGETFDPEKDWDRLGRQLSRVLLLMLPGGWWTLGKLSVEAGAPQASVSARLRDLRRIMAPSGYVVERKREKNGLHWYRLTKGVSR